MDYKKMREQEKNLLERDMFMLCIGAVIVMLLVALTLNIPNKSYPPFDKQCYQACRKIVASDFEKKRDSFMTTSRFIVAINKCMEACEEEKNESVGKGLAP